MIDIKVIENFVSVHRFSGSFLFQSETVPDHSVEMALLCINFSELVPESDKKDLCYRCVIHDLEESLSSDVPRPLKWACPELKELIDNTAYKLLESSSDEELVSEVKTAKSFDNVNGFLVHIADRVQCFLKMRREVELYGNNSLKCDFEAFKSNIFYLLQEVGRYEFMAKSSKENLKSYLNKLIINN